MQVLVYVFTPPPHVLLHFDSDQSVYPPLIAFKEKHDTKLNLFLVVHALFVIRKSSAKLQHSKLFNFLISMKNGYFYRFRISLS